MTAGLPTTRGEARPATCRAAAVCLDLLGGFSVTGDGEPWELPLSAQRVLAFLALHERPLLRLYVAGALWPGSSESRAAASLRTVIWRMHRPPAGLLAVSGGRLGLAAGVSVDVREIRAAARRTLSGEAPPTRADLDLLVHARDLLPDWYDDWVLMEREQLREQRVRALEKLCDDWTAASRFAEAAQAGLAAVACEPLRESAHRALIRLHLAEGNESQALRRYAEYRALLGRKLGLAPSPRMEELLAGLSRRRVRPVVDGTARQARASG